MIDTFSCKCMTFISTKGIHCAVNGQYAVAIRMHTVIDLLKAKIHPFDHASAEEKIAWHVKSIISL